MAKGDKEHRMLFDLRGRRRNLVKVVYATLAVLMGLSLFLVIGGFNIAELFDSNTSSGDAAKPYEEQAERIEAKLRKNPEDQNLLISLTRAQINAGNASVQLESNGQRIPTVQSLQQYQQASQTWSDYLRATDEPSVSVAQLMAPTLFTLAELARSIPETLTNLNAAVEAQQIVAEQRPTLNSLSTLALYTYFTGDFKAAEKARAEASKLTKGKLEQESLDKQLDEIKKRAKEFQKRVKSSEKAETPSKPVEGAPESPEAGPLNEALTGGGSGLTE
jgi:hypothetical protein